MWTLIQCWYPLFSNFTISVLIFRSGHMLSLVRSCSLLCYTRSVPFFPVLKTFSRFSIVPMYCTTDIGGSLFSGRDVRRCAEYTTKYLTALMKNALFSFVTFSSRLSLRSRQKSRYRSACSRHVSRREPFWYSWKLRSWILLCSLSILIETPAASSLVYNCFSFFSISDLHKKMLC